MWYSRFSLFRSKTAQMLCTDSGESALAFECFLRYWGRAGEFHTHPNTGGTWIESHSDSDIKYAIDPSFVVGRENTWLYKPNISASPKVIFSSLNFNPYYHNIQWLKY
jgi:hypothetical protein